MTAKTEIKRILAPTDFSPTSEAACRLAARLAIRAEAQLIVFHAMPSPDLVQQMQGGRSPAEILKDARGRLGEWFTAVVPAELRSFPATEFTVVSGEPAPEIARAAKANGADLILMATQGRTGLAHLLMGSVTEAVLRTAPVPVLALRRGQEERPLAAVQRMLWPTDLSPASEAALPYVLRLADLLAAEVVLVHAVHPKELAGLADHLVPPPARMLERYLSPLKRELESRKETIEALGLPVRWKVVVGVPADVIMAEAQGEQGDLIVMATRGRTGLSHILLGSVAAEVIRKAACPVLAVQIKAQAHSREVEP